jgi:hypothetical protein
MTTAPPRHDPPPACGMRDHARDMRPDLLALLGARARAVDALRDRIVCADALSLLRALPAGCVDMALTSPPYDNLRTYHRDLGFSPWKPRRFNGRG